MCPSARTRPLWISTTSSVICSISWSTWLETTTVVPAAPSNLFLYLQTVAYGLRGLDFTQNFSKYAGLFELIRQDTEELSSILSTGHGHLRKLTRNLESVQQRTQDIQHHLEHTDHKTDIPRQETPKAEVAAKTGDQPPSPSKERR